ncbi:MAG: UPF0280 family protein [bacterium]
MADSSRRQHQTSDYIDRSYRDFSSGERFVAFSVAWKETDLYIKAARDLSNEALQSAMRCRRAIEEYIAGRPGFETSWVPLAPDPEAPAVVREMLRAAAVASVGPMAAVAGAISEEIGRDLAAFSEEVIVENGGDIYLALSRPAVVGLFAGASSLSMRIGVRIEPGATPCGLCTSSGTVGPSLSLGRADAVTVWAPSAALADAAATGLGNMVTSPDEIEPALERAQAIPGLTAVMIVCGDRIGVWGPLDLVQLESSTA